MRIPALLFCHHEVRVAKPKSDRFAKELKTSGAHIRARCMDLGLFQPHIGERIGVCEQIVTNWESNATEPPVQYIPAVIRFLGHDPLASLIAPLPEHLMAVRRSQGMTQKQLASTLGVDLASIRDWETVEHEPNRKKRELIDAFLH